MRVNKDNFDYAMTMLFYGCKQADYNPECFSVHDIQFHYWANMKAQDAIDAMRKAGYDPYLLMPVLQKPEINFSYHLPPNPALKQKLDHQFSVEVDDHLYQFGFDCWNRHQQSGI